MRWLRGRCSSACASIVLAFTCWSCKRHRREVKADVLGCKQMLWLACTFAQHLSVGFFVPPPLFVFGVGSDGG